MSNNCTILIAILVFWNNQIRERVCVYALVCIHIFVCMQALCKFMRFVCVCGGGGWVGDPISCLFSSVISIRDCSAADFAYTISGN